jgi:transcriptional antiterminator NusG
MVDEMTEENGGMISEEQEAVEQPMEEAAPEAEASVDAPEDEQVEAAAPEEEAAAAPEEATTEESAAQEPVTEAEATEGEPEEVAAEPQMEEPTVEAAEAGPDEGPSEEPAAEETEMAEAEPEEPVAEEPEMAETETGEAAAAAPIVEEAQAEPETTPEPEMAEEPDDGRAWYVVHCYSGYENKVRHNLEQRIDSMGMKDRIFDVVVPTEEEIEVKEGKRRTVERRVFPGYILVNMILTEESWYVVRNTPGVTSFVGQGNEPLPLRPEEVAQIIKRMEADAPRIKVSFRQGERVRIVDGPFNDFRGTVDEIDMERSKVRVMVNFFGRETPVELDFLQVEKA